MKSKWLTAGLGALAAALTVSVVWTYAGAQLGMVAGQPPVHADYPVKYSVQDLTQAAPLIVVGTVEKVAGTRNLARDVNDPSKEDANLEILGVDYAIKVETYLKGQGPAELLLTETKSIHNKERSATPTMIAGFMEMDLGGRYVLFIQPTTDGSGRYLGVAEPSKFKLDRGSVKVHSKLEATPADFRNLKEADLLAKVKANAK